MKPLLLVAVLFVLAQPALAQTTEGECTNTSIENCREICGEFEQFERDPVRQGMGCLRLNLKYKVCTYPMISKNLDALKDNVNYNASKGHYIWDYAKFTYCDESIEKRKMDSAEIDVYDGFLMRSIHAGLHGFEDVVVAEIYKIFEAGDKLDVYKQLVLRKEPYYEEVDGFTQRFDLNLIEWAERMAEISEGRDRENYTEIAEGLMVLIAD